MKENLINRLMRPWSFFRTHSKGLKGPIQWFRYIMAILFVLVFSVGLFLGALGYWIWKQIPSDEEIKGCLTTKMFQVYLCPKSKDYVPLQQISNHLIQSVLISEDSAFYSHQGFDFREIENSFKTNLEKGTFVRGGSTITQQLTKNMFLSKEKTVYRKALEALITVKMERLLTKKEILERYLNVIQYGKDIYGIKKAADHYFQKSPQELTLPESAFLAFLLPNPEKYSISFYKKQLSPYAHKRISQIINHLFQYQKISEEEYQQATLFLDKFLSQSSEDSENVENSIIEEPEVPQPEEMNETLQN